jgi:hypothetical protein
MITDNIPLHDIFHSLEFDRAAMIEQRKLEVIQANVPFKFISTKPTRSNQ